MADRKKPLRKKRTPRTKSAGKGAHVGDPVEAVKHLTEVERLRFFECEIATRNHAQEIKILDQEQRIEANEFDARKRTRQARVDVLKRAIEIRGNEQRVMLATLGKKHDFDPNFVSIDDTTGAIQEHKPEK